MMKRLWAWLLRRKPAPVLWHEGHVPYHAGAAGSEIVERAERIRRINRSTTPRQAAVAGGLSAPQTKENPSGYLEESV